MPVSNVVTLRCADCFACLGRLSKLLCSIDICCESIISSFGDSYVSVAVYDTVDNAAVSIVIGKLCECGDSVWVGGGPLAKK